MPIITLDEKPIAGASKNLEAELTAWFADSNNRTAEEITVARQTVFNKAPRPLPKGKTLEAVFVGALPDDKSDEEISAALSELE